MSADLKAKKRKSADRDATGQEVTSKKAKVTTSAEKPAPLKSALKKTKSGGTPAVPAKKEKATVAKTSDKVEKDVEVVPHKSGKDAKSKTTSRTNRKAADGKKTAVIPDEEGAEAGTELTEDQTAALLAGFSSSDEDEDADDEGIALSKLPNAPTTPALQKKIEEAVGPSDPEATPGVVYVGRIPHGFYEKQMRAYFSQFGEITNLRLARNRKTGKSQHFAFVEFASAAVAEIVAKTMDKYLMFSHILQVRKVPREQVTESMFRGANKRIKVLPRNKIEGGRLRRGRSREAWEKSVDSENKRRSEKAEKLKEMGYEFDLPQVKPVADVAVAAKAVEAPAKPNELSGPANAEGEDATPAIDVAQAIEVEPAAAKITETLASKKRDSADGVKKIKKAKRVKTAA